MSLLKVNKLKTYFYTPLGAIRAVDDVSFELKKGIALGLAGESGCGKSTTARSILRIVPYPGRILEGEVLLENIDLLKLSDDELREIRWKRISMIFQGAMAALNPLFKIGTQIAEPIMLHEGLSKKDAMDRTEELLELVGIDPERVDNYSWEFSGGMRQRVMVAMALACNPELIIADEPKTALDVLVGAQIMDLLKDLRSKLNLSMLLITHDISVIAKTCDELAIMYAGKLVEHGNVPTLFKSPAHPYTHALISSFPSIIGPKQILRGLEGNPPNLITPPLGCRFNPRCPYAKKLCREKEPELLEIDKDHFVACHLVDQISLSR